LSTPRELGIAVGAGASEATIIRALMAVGAVAMREQALVRGYQQVVAMYGEVHDAEEKAARRRHYAGRVDRLMPEGPLP
jgi:hypothetical protein